MLYKHSSVVQCEHSLSGIQSNTISGRGQVEKVDLLRYFSKIDLEKLDFFYFFDLKRNRPSRASGEHRSARVGQENFLKFQKLSILFQNDRRVRLMNVTARV